MPRISPSTRLCRLDTTSRAHLCEWFWKSYTYVNPNGCRSNLFFRDISDRDPECLQAACCSTSQSLPFRPSLIPFVQPQTPSLQLFVSLSTMDLQNRLRVYFLQKPFTFLKNMFSSVVSKLNNCHSFGLSSRVKFIILRPYLDLLQLVSIFVEVLCLKLKAS